MEAALPGDINGYISLLGSIFSVIGGVWFLSWRLSKYKTDNEHRFSTQGERIGKAETSLSSVISSVSELRGMSQTTEFKIMNLTEGHGEQRARFESVLARLEEQDERKRKDEVEVASRLASIETQLRIFIDLYKNHRG